ncbi:hypothetical protein B0H19DRAFT_1152200, partial [Mycena capillaripes]
IFIAPLFGFPPSADILAHLKRELMHGIWDLLLSDDFIHAYVHGIVVKCYDGIEHLIFPRFFTYGADYPEKVLLATIKYFGGCPCPRCFIDKSKIPEMGSKRDMKRREKIREDSPRYQSTIACVRGWIFEKGRLVAGAAVNRVLKPFSWVPTCNAFSKLAKYGFNFYTMFVPDLLHEVELGGWKSLFTHLVRIVQAEDDDLVGKLDERFRKIPTFGRSTIRRFHANVSEMKKMAARDFEDILQVRTISLHYSNNIHENSCKLRMHSDSTIKSFRIVTAELGSQARHFHKTTSKKYVTYELPAEYNRRARRLAKKNSALNPNPAITKKLEKERKAWNLATYKWHSMGDYPDAIVEIGTTDSYSTQILSHRVAKKLYAKTNKRIFEQQIAASERRRRLALAIKKRLDDATIEQKNASEQSVRKSTDSTQSAIARTQRRLVPEDDNLPRTPPRDHHHISESKRTFIRTDELSDEFPDDPAAKDFLPKLKSHLLGRLLDVPYDGEEATYSLQELADVNIIGERLYTHKVLRVNHTTYDVRRDQDTLNPRTHPDFMVLAHEDEDEATAHPYWYGRIIAIFHVAVRHVGEHSKNRTKIHRMEFVWVRWFGRDMTHPGGWQFKRPHRLGFVDASEPDSGAFGFLDPKEIICAAHLIPAFHYGWTSQLLGPSVARMFDGDNDEDYSLTLCSFVDRVMFMRYSEDAVGDRTGRKAPSAGPLNARTPSESDEEDDEMDVDSPQAPMADDESGSDEDVPDNPDPEPDNDLSDSEESGEEDDPVDDGTEPAAITEEDILEYGG